MSTPASFDLASDATALEAFTAIVTALDWSWEGPAAARLQGRADVRHHEEIAWGVDVVTHLSLGAEKINGATRYTITVKISTSSMYRSTVQTVALVRLLQRAADVGAFVESTLNGRSWSTERRGW